MALLIRKPGILSTIQDLGRDGARSFGINPGGAMDRAGMRTLNILLGNPDSLPVLEMHFPAAEIEFEDKTIFALGGGDFGAEIDGTAIHNWTVSRGDRGSVLRLRRKVDGQRSYLAVAGGFVAGDWLASCSTNLVARVGGHEGRALAAGDKLERGRAELPTSLGLSMMPRHIANPTIRVLPGPEFDLLTATGERDFLTAEFKLSTNCDRMGYRVQGLPLHLLHEREMVSAGVTFGTIQLLPDGQMIILMADHQTSGGYPRIANVISVDLPLLAQCGPGDKIRFELVTIDIAQEAALRFERQLNFLRVGCRLQTQNAKR